MERIVEVRSDEKNNPIIHYTKVQPLSPEVWQRHSPTAHYHLLRDDLLIARCSIWAESTPQYLGEPVGVIGHYAAEGISAGSTLLRHAASQLKLRGFRQVIGPMDGNTWRSYRLLTHRGSELPFFLEPDNPDDWPDHFIAAGFRPVAQYFSALNDDLSVTDSRVPQASARLNEKGVRVRQFDPAQAEQDLKAVHELSVTAFGKNFLYTPISQAEFLEMYAPIIPHLRPELILLAEQGAQLIGFMFGLPDLLQANRGTSINTVIAKSLAVRPGRTGAGLGSVLMEQFHQNARLLGYNRVIHALMHENNTSRKISQRFGELFRQYTLYVQDTAQ